MRPQVQATISAAATTLSRKVITVHRHVIMAGIRAIRRRKPIMPSRKATVLRPDITVRNEATTLRRKVTRSPRPITARRSVTPRRKAPSKATHHLRDTVRHLPDTAPRAGEFVSLKA